MHSHNYLNAGLGNYYPNNAPNNQAYSYYQQPNQQSAGQEAIAQAATAAAANNEKKRSFEGVNEFFEDAKRHKLQPVYDSAMAQRLSALQFVPSTTGEGVDFNGHTQTATAPSSGPQQFTLPALRTKQDLLDADNFLTQLSANVYDNGQQRQQFQYQQSASPHTPATQQPSPQQHEGSAPAASMAPTSQAGPALTPPTSNYTTSHSPHTQHTTPTVSPQASAASMYPSLPAVASADNSQNGYPAPVSSAPASSLGPNFESAEARRYTVPVLRRAQGVEDMSLEDPKGISSSLIDPSLGDLTNDAAESESCSQRNADMINNMHSLIKKMIVEIDRTGESLVNDEGQDGGGSDHAMGDSQTAQQEREAQDKQQEEDADAKALYPILKAVAAC